MAIPIIARPWKKMQKFIEAGDIEGFQAFIETVPPSEMALGISRLEPGLQQELFALLSPSDAASLVENMPIRQAADLIARMPAGRAAAIIDEAPSAWQADLLGKMETSAAHAVMQHMSPDEARNVRRLLEYAEDTAGGIMITEFLAYPGNWKIHDLLHDFKTKREEYADYSVQYLFVVDEARKLEGVLRMRDLVFSDESASLSSVMIRNPIAVPADAKLEKIQELFDSHSLLGLPVVDDADRLVGILRRAAVEEAVARRANRQFLGFSGIVGGEEFRTMPLRVRSGRRLSWLSINIVLNIIAASVIALYQDTLQAVIALAVFLPIISDMSGCSGNQAVAVSMRELTLGLIRPTELARVFFKEAGVGLLNGLVLGILLGGAALLWKGNPWLGLVVASALAINTIVAVSIGGMLPLLLKRLKLDPALVSSPLLTTVTDMFGFFLVLSLATMMLTKLT
jgi:magnesium transporter